MEGLFLSLLYDALKMGGKLLVGKYTLDFQKARKATLGALDKEFGKQKIECAFSSYTHLKALLSFDRERLDSFLSLLKQGVQLEKDEQFVEALLDEVETYPKHDRKLAKQIISRFIQLFLVKLADNNELFDYINACRQKAEHAEMLSILRNLKPAKQPPATPWNVPFRPNPNFIGRDAEMQTLKKMLQQGTTAVISQVSQISGMGGVGKTQLAVEYAHKYKDGYLGGVLWVRGAEDVLSEYGLLSDELGLGLPMNMEESEKCHKVQQCLQQRQEQTLLILDNLDEKGAYESVHQYLPTTGNCQILITTRRKDLEAGKALSLDILPDDEALKLLVTESGRDGEDEAAAQNICRSLGNLPLAIEAAGRYFKYSNKMISFQQYHAKLIEAGAIGVLPDKGKLPHVEHIASVKATLMVNKELMDNPQIRKTLTAIICFEPDSINPEILALVCGIEREKLDELISILDNYSLVNIQEDNRLSIHRLMREALREQIPREEIKARQKEYVIQLQKWFREHNKVDTLKITTPEIPHILGAARLSAWPQSWDLCFDLGTYYWFMGRYQEYLAWAQKSEAEVKNNAPRNDERLGRSYNEMGLAWKSLGEYKKAIDSCKQALPLHKKHYGKKHPQVATVLNNLGAAWDDFGKHEKAIGYYEQALAIWKEAYGERHPQVATGLNNLGEAWRALWKYKKAIGYYQQALSIDKQYYGERHPDVARDLNNQGLAWGSLKQYDKAREYFQQAYSIFVEFLGEDHPHTKIAKENLEGLPG